MLTDPKLRSQVDQLWDKFWSGGLTNPLDVIEQFSYLLFLKRLDDSENARERQARMRSIPWEPKVPPEMRWSQWTQFKADAALRHIKETVFSWFRSASGNGSSFERTVINPLVDFEILKTEYTPHKTLCAEFGELFTFQITPLGKGLLEVIHGAMKQDQP